MKSSIASVSLCVAGLTRNGPDPITRDGRTCIMFGDTFFHGSKADFGAFQAALADAIAQAWPEEKPDCPICGETTGEAVEFDGGIDPETGYHDAGEGCTECMPGGAR